jgi:hypothetical protein
MLKQRVKQLTLSNPAMFLFSAKNSAGDSAAKKKDPERIKENGDTGQE